MTDTMSGFLEPKEIEINGARFIISKLPCTAAREVVYKYSTSNIPKVGNYAASEEVMLKLVSFAARITPDGGALRLTSKALVDNHVPDWETLTKLEWEMMRYNCSFFQNGKASDFFQSLGALAKSKVTEILTDLLAKSLPVAKPRSKN